MHKNAKVFIFDLFRPVLNNTNGKSISSFSLYTTYTSYDTYVNMTGWLAIYCNAATRRSRFDQKAAWMVSQASGSQVWRDLIAVLIAGSYSDDQWSSQLLRGDTRPRCLPQGDVGLPISLQIFVAQLARLLLEFWWQHFFLHPPPSGDFVPGQLAVGVWDTNHWAIEEQLKYKREKCGMRKIPVQVYFAGVKIKEFWHMS